MPSSLQKPAEYLAEGGYFPDGPFIPETPPEVHLAKALAKRLNKRIGNESVRYVAKKAGVHHQTVFNILKGTTWPNLRTIARLETALKARLWGYEHRKYDQHYI